MVARTSIRHSVRLSTVVSCRASSPYDMRQDWPELVQRDVRHCRYTYRRPRGLDTSVTLETIRGSTSYLRDRGKTHTSSSSRLSSGTLSPQFEKTTRLTEMSPEHFDMAPGVCQTHPLVRNVNIGTTSHQCAVGYTSFSTILSKTVRAKDAQAFGLPDIAARYHDVLVATPSARHVGTLGSAKVNSVAGAAPAPC